MVLITGSNPSDDRHSPTRFPGDGMRDDSTDNACTSRRVVLHEVSEGWIRRASSVGQRDES